MKKSRKKYNFIQRIARAFRYNFIKLLRSPGGARKVSLGFAIGFGLEMIVLSTASLIYIIFYPIVRLCKASLPAAIIGNIIGKLTFLPVILIPFAKQLGSWIYPAPETDKTGTEHSILEIFYGNFQVFRDILHGGLHILLGMTVFGIMLGFISYFVIHRLYTKHLDKRKARAIKKSSQNVSF
jgi:uncharacterized protein (DUF2062 family)